MAGQWVVLVEQVRGHAQNGPWRPVRPQASFSTRDQAQHAALEMTRTHQPDHPKRERERLILRHDDGSYTVIVQGMTADFHFKVSVCHVVS